MSLSYNTLSGSSYSEWHRRMSREAFEKEVWNERHPYLITDKIRFDENKAESPSRLRRFASGGFMSHESSEDYRYPLWLKLPTTPRYGSLDALPHHLKPHSTQSRWLEEMDNILSGYLNPKFLSISGLKNNKFDMKNFNCGDTVFFFVPMQAAPKVGSGVIKAKRTAETLDGKMEIEYDIDGTKLDDDKVFKTKEALLATL